MEQKKWLEHELEEVKHDISSFSLYKQLHTLNIIHNTQFLTFVFAKKISYQKINKMEIIVIATNFSFQIPISLQHDRWCKALIYQTLTF